MDPVDLIDLLEPITDAAIVRLLWPRGFRRVGKSGRKLGITNIFTRLPRKASCSYFVVMRCTYMSACPLMLIAHVPCPMPVPHARAPAQVQYIGRIGGNLDLGMHVLCVVCD